MTKTELTRVNRPAWQPNGVTPLQAGRIVCSFLDTATTAMGRATHYNTREEQQAAELRAHQDLFHLHRGLYTALLVLPGLTDRSRQIGLKSLLSSRHDGNPIVAPEVEREVIYRLFQSMPPTRMLRTIEGFRVGDEALGLKKANNARTRKLILRTLLSSPRLPLWCVKYQKKVRTALTHAWGQRKTTVIREALRAYVLGEGVSSKQSDLLTREVWRPAGCRMDRAQKVSESVGFALGLRGRFYTPLLVAFNGAKEDLKKGKGLPLEVLEGIRGTYHKDVSKAELLELTKETLTKTQRKNVQAQAAKAGVEVEMNPLDYEAVDLYIYAFEREFTQEIQKALMAKAKKAARTFLASYDRVGILVDASASMAGHETQKLRPMAATLALRDMLVQSSVSFCQEVVGGEGEGWILRPQGDTELADGLVKVLEERPEVVYVLSDGYENAPAGRFRETVDAVRQIGIETPIYHLNPVFAAEASGVRSLAEGVPSMPAQSPGAVGAAFLRGMIEDHPVPGINHLLDGVLPRELPAPQTAKKIVLRPDKEVRG